MQSAKISLLLILVNCNYLQVKQFTTVQQFSDTVFKVLQVKSYRNKSNERVMLRLLTIANDTTQLQGFPNCAMQGRSRWYNCVNKIGSKTSDEESTNESYIFITH